jgi:hypothetical protein
MNAQRIAPREQRAEDLPVEALPYLSNDEVEEGYAEIHEAASAMEAKRLSWLAELDERRTWATRGHLSTVSWLAQRFGIGRGAAAADTRTARALKHMPAVREALASGEVSAPAVRVLAEARQSAREAFARSERLLLEGAKSLSLEGLRTAVAYWRQAVDSAGADRDAEGRWRRRRLHISPTAFGMVRIDGTSIPRREKRSSPRCEPAWTPPGRLPHRQPHRQDHRSTHRQPQSPALRKAASRPRNAGRTPWARSAGSGSIGLIALAWEASGGT